MSIFVPQHWRIASGVADRPSTELLLFNMKSLLLLPHYQSMSISFQMRTKRTNPSMYPAPSLNGDLVRHSPRIVGFVLLGVSLRATEEIGIFAAVTSMFNGSYMLGLELPIIPSDIWQFHTNISSVHMLYYVIQSIWDRRK